MLDTDLLRFDNSKKLCFIDFETENLCLLLSQNLPWQVAMVMVTGQDITARTMRYIKWDRPPNVSKDAAEKTHFQPEWVSQQGVPYQDVISEVVDWTSQADIIVGHNVLGFDIHFISAFYRMRGLSPSRLSEKVVDTHALAKGIKLSKPFDPKKCSLVEYQYEMINTIAKGVKTRMEVLGPELGIEHDYSRLHDALVDLELNVKIWHKLKQQVNV